MIYSELVNKAIDLAYEYHHGQRDKAGRPYFSHVWHVAEQMDDEYSVCVALLHDTLEDTHIDPAYLEEIFPSEVVEAVKVLTHDDNVSYVEYIREVAKNPLARKVKLADLEHNLDLSRFEGCGEWRMEKARKRRSKYEEAKRILLEEENS